jgi:hypothetical protein
MTGRKTGNDPNSTHDSTKPNTVNTFPLHIQHPHAHCSSRTRNTGSGIWNIQVQITCVHTHQFHAVLTTTVTYISSVRHYTRHIDSLLLTLSIHRPTSLWTNCSANNSTPTLVWSSDTNSQITLAWQPLDSHRTTSTWFQFTSTYFQSIQNTEELVSLTAQTSNAMQHSTAHFMYSDYM